MHNFIINNNKNAYNMKFMLILNRKILTNIRHKTQKIILYQTYLTFN
jgi:hypothetical protein